MPLTRALPAATLLIAIAATALPAAGQDGPRRKSGLWEVKGENMPAMSTCVDQASDDALRSMAGNMRQQTECKQNSMKREGNRIVSESVCKFGNTTATTRTVATGDFQTAYTVDSTSRYDPPLAGRSESHVKMEARWVGPCKPGMKPGDMVMPNGQVISGDMMRKMQDAMKK